MRRIQKVFFGFLSLAVFAGAVYAGQIQVGTFYAAIEQDGVICGYVESDVSRAVIDGREAIVIRDYTEMRLTALGAEVNTKVKSTSYVDELSGDYFFSEFDVDQGTVQIGATVVIENDTAIITSRPDGKVERVALPPGVLLENNHFRPHLLRDFAVDSPDEKQYDALDQLDGVIHKVTYTRIAVGELELAGQKFQTIEFRRLDHATGFKITVYIDANDGSLLKGVLPTRSIYLADESVKGKVEQASIDDQIISKTNVRIADYKTLSYIKVQATLEPGGNWVTEDGLNVPGQKFEGTVEENFIDGVFEISHPRYDGSDAPPFPADFGGDPALTKYLDPEDFIESDDPVLTAKAQEITAGSKDSWEAFCRLSRWVSDEISYDIPGGGGARNTYDLRLGECGSHSRLLAAFARAVGIPCRVIWGCMYIPEYGGGFGQHGWNEVYMGRAGWVPVDATAEEIDYVDSGHLRIGELASKSIFLNAQKMTILDYRAGDVTMANAGQTAVPDEHRKYIGKYKGEAGTFTVLAQNQSLAVDIPGKMVFELKEPDDAGRWVFKLTDDAGIIFQEEGPDEITGMTLVSSAKLPRKSDGEAAEADTRGAPDEYSPYIGTYVVPMQNMDLTVIYRDDNLAVIDPNEGTIRLKGPDSAGEWVDEFDKNKISFELDEEGRASSLVFHRILTFSKID